MAGRNRKQLTDEQQRFSVQLLACFRTPSEVVEALQQKFKIAVARQLVEHYDPTKKAGETLNEELKELFFNTRKSYLEKIEDIGLTHQVYRIDRLQEMFISANLGGNIVEARNCLEQAAKELGGAYTNKRELSGPNGKPIETVSLTLDEWKKQADERKAQVESTMQLFTEG
ncbi:MAG: DUF2280 domain-containing protein [Pyrinomonadaceae bacterium]